MDAKTGSEGIEESCWKSFSKKVCVLVVRRDVKYSDLSEFDVFPDKVDVYFHVFCPLMLDRIGREIDRTYIIAVDYGCSLNGAAKFKKKIADPSCFSDSVCDSTVLCLRA